MAMPLWVPSGKLGSRLHLQDLWPEPTELTHLCILVRIRRSLFYISQCSAVTTLKCTLVPHVHFHRTHIPACSSNLTTPSFPFDTLSFPLFPKLYINSVGLYCLVFCLSARCASIRHQLPATFTGCKHLGKAFHLVNVARGPRGSGLAPR